MDKITSERFFSVELKSKLNLNNVTMHNGGHENVLVEGTIGQLLHAGFIEGIILEIVGDRGILRINLSQDEIKRKEKQETQV